MRAPVYLVTGWYDNNYGPIGATRGFNGMRLQAATPEARERTKLIIEPWAHSSIHVLNTRFTTAHADDFSHATRLGTAIVFTWSFCS